MTVPSLRISPVSRPQASVRIVGVQGEGTSRTLVSIPQLSHLADTVKTIEAGTTTESFARIPDPSDPRRSIVIVGLGKNATADDARLAAGQAVRKLAGSGEVEFCFGFDDEDHILAVAEGALMGAYSFTAYRGKAATIIDPVKRVHIVTQLRVSTERVEGIVGSAESVAFVKDLVNTPGNDLYPESMVSRITEELKGLGVTSTVWNEKRLAADGCGGILGVGQGSARPPRLMKITYRPTSATFHLALVGKGITFDSGGLSLKTGPGMVGMKYDMTGAATVAAVVRELARRKVNLRVTAWLAMAENMPSAQATRPNDVLTMRNGKTVEVLNTDAEGRLVLADALSLASEETPDLIVDVATLTGAATIALGTRHVGAMGDAEYISRLVESGRAHGENVWHMPIPEESRGILNSEVADIANAKPGNTAGGMLVAAAFLREFVGNTGKRGQETPIPWVHLDIASSANNGAGAYGFTSAGPTGTTVRCLIDFAERLAT